MDLDITTDKTQRRINEYQKPIGYVRKVNDLQVLWLGGLGRFHSPLTPTEYMVKSAGKAETVKPC